jgi:hypothetical protein
VWTGTIHCLRHIHSRLAPWPHPALLPGAFFLMKSGGEWRCLVVNAFIAWWCHMKNFNLYVQNININLSKCLTRKLINVTFLKIGVLKLVKLLSSLPVAPWHRNEIMRIFTLRVSLRANTPTLCLQETRPLQPPSPPFVTAMKLNLSGVFFIIWFCYKSKICI